MRLPPLIAWYQNLLDTHLVLAVVLGIVLVAVGVLLIRIAIKPFAIFLLLLLILIFGSYLFLGEVRTERALRQGLDNVEDALDRGADDLPEPELEPEPKTPR